MIVVARLKAIDTDVVSAALLSRKTLPTITEAKVAALGTVTVARPLVKVGRHSSFQKLDIRVRRQRKTWIWLAREIFFCPPVNIGRSGSPVSVKVTKSEPAGNHHRCG